jgi:hypothetical protein
MWPVVMCRDQRWSYLNVAVAATCVADCHVQLETISSQLSELGLVTDEETLWIVHSGGNDMLFGLVENYSQLILDIIRLHISRSLGLNLDWLISSGKSDSRLSYYPRGAHRVAQETTGLLKQLCQRFGARRFLVSSNTISSAMPLCRYCRFITTPLQGLAVLDGIALIMGHRLTSALVAFQEENKGKVDVAFFDESECCVASKTMSWASDAFHPGDHGNDLLSAEAREALKRAEPVAAVAARKLRQLKSLHHWKGIFGAVFGFLEALATVICTMVVSVPMCILIGLLQICGIESLIWASFKQKKASRLGKPDFEQLKGWELLEVTPDGAQPYSSSPSVSPLIGKEVEVEASVEGTGPATGDGVATAAAGTHSQGGNRI